MTPRWTRSFLPPFPAWCYDACQGFRRQHRNSFQAALNHQAVVTEFERETEVKDISKRNLGNIVTCLHAAFYCLLFIRRSCDGKCDAPDVNYRGANFPARNEKESVALFLVGFKKPAYMGSKSWCKNGLCVSSHSTRHIFQMAAWLFEAEGGKNYALFSHKKVHNMKTNVCITAALLISWPINHLTSPDLSDLSWKEPDR